MDEGSSGNWMWRHPKFQELTSLDVADSNQLYSAFLVYLDLTEVRQWHEVTCKSCDNLQLIYFEGREGEGAPLQLVVPVQCQRLLSHQWLRSVLSLVSPDGSPHQSVLIVAVASDSSLVYHRFTDGFVTPEPPDHVLNTGKRSGRRKRPQV
ncbi:tRNA-splicing endonuclease subunit Sen15 [Erpetoichthys calabaricus]|uniref:tRNA-splicing endonuclease subunit Sen15 n=1 Tax=Erpetoichthys calabaricus TaxID=27687 RepID=UPI0022344158|nr:tRNA-splicing endonuclease subunit Sen15 [Erpetoichthys calabaricus]